MITSMFEKKTATLVMNMRMSERDDLPPGQAEKCTAIKTLKVAEKEKFPSSFASSSARKADLPRKSSENKLGLSCAKLRTASLLRLLLLVNSNFGNVKNEVLHVR